MQLSHHRKGQRGFSLIEVLVALVVLSIGMLGIAALYVDSLRSGRTAIHRTQAGRCVTGSIAIHNVSPCSIVNSTTGRPSST